MESPSGRWVISYNGEIYNHQEIREELKRAGLNHAWRGHSDTETLLAAIDASHTGVWLRTVLPAKAAPRIATKSRRKDVDREARPA